MHVRASWFICLLLAGCAGDQEQQVVQTVAVSPLSLDFPLGVNDAQLQLTNDSAQPTEFGIVVDLNDEGQSWLTLSPAMGTIAGGASQTVLVQVINRDLLVPGNYGGFLRVSGGDETDEILVGLSLMVGQPVLDLQPPDVIDFGKAQSKTLTVRNAGQGLLEYELDALPEWLFADLPLAGALGAAESAVYTLTVDRTLVPWYGESSAQLLITSNGLNDATHDGTAVVELVVTVDATCVNDGQCVKEGFYCDFSGGPEGICSPSKDNGQPCSEETECASGFCAGWVCCDSQCDDECRTCVTAGAIGTCTTAADDTPCLDDTGLCQNGACVGE